MISTGKESSATVDFLSSPERLQEMLVDLRKNNFPLERLNSFEQSSEGRSKLVDEFKRITGTNGEAEQVLEELKLFTKEAKRGEKFLESAASPEKKGMFSRAWDGVKNFAKRHPFVTAAMVLALAAGGVAAGFYYAGNWELLMSNLGLAKVQGVAGAAQQLAPVTPMTPAIPGGGAYVVPPPTVAPGEFPFVPH